MADEVGSAALQSGQKIIEVGAELIKLLAPLFEKMLAEAAKESGRRVRTVEIRTQAPDHPALLNEEETQYLKCFVLQVL